MYRYSFEVFWPVLGMLLLPALFLLPGGALMFLVAVLDHTVSIASVAGYEAWVVCPIAGAVIILVSGRWGCAYYVKTEKPRQAWIMLWCIFSAGVFIAAWYAISVITSIGASDYSTTAFLSWTASAAAGLTFVGQIGVIPWLLIATKALCNIRNNDRE